MGKYSISDLEQLSGIKAHTIRIWEQRYNLLHPARTGTNIRYYDDEQLRKLLNITILLKNGMKISQVSRLSEKDISSKMEEAASEKIASRESQADVFINQFISSGITFNEVQFDRTFSTCLLRYGLEETYTRIIFPFLQKIGILWGKSEVNPAQEHFLSNLIKQKLLTAIDGLPVVTDPKKTFILFLHEDEDHEIALIVSNYLLRLHKIKVIYLGQRVPYSSLKDAIDSCRPTHIMTFFIRHQPAEVLEKYILQLSSNFSKIKLVISGNPMLLQDLNLPQNTVWIRDIEEFREKIIGR